MLLTLGLPPSDMEKFPVRMKDNDLLVTQLFEDPCKEAITALSVYFTPNVCKSRDFLYWMVVKFLYASYLLCCYWLVCIQLHIWFL